MRGFSSTWVGTVEYHGILLARVYTDVLHFHFHPSHRCLQPFRFRFYVSVYQMIPQKVQFTFTPSHVHLHTFTGLVGHTCPKGGHMCPPSPMLLSPRCVKGESGSAELRCIRARGKSWAQMWWCRIIRGTTCLRLQPSQGLIGIEPFLAGKRQGNRRILCKFAIQ